MVINLDRLLFLDVSSKEKIASWYWKNLHLLRVGEGSAQQTVMFEAMCEHKGGDTQNDIGGVFKNIYLETESNKYLYSIAIHVQKILEKKICYQKFPTCRRSCV